MPSSRHSWDTDVSRCAIAAWASRTWAFDSANFLPPLRPAGPRGRLAERVDPRRGADRVVLLKIEDGQTGDL